MVRLSLWASRARRGGITLSWVRAAAFRAVAGGAWLLIALQLAACAPVGGGRPQADAAASLHDPKTLPPRRLDGSVTIRERFALPPASVVRITLYQSGEDARDPDGDWVAQQEIVTVGEQAPIPFELTVDGDRIDPSRSYALAAEIEIDGQVRFAAPFAVPVLTRGAPSTSIELELRDRFGAP